MPMVSRLYDASTGETMGMRSKEHAHDYQIGFGEVTVIVRVLFAAHAHGLAGRSIVEPRLLLHFATRFENRDLACDLVIESHLQEPERVQVFHFGFGSEL